MAQCLEIAQERGCHALPIHNHTYRWCLPFAVLIASQNLWEYDGQVLISSIRRCQSRMPLIIVQEHQRSAPQNFARASNESTRDQLVSIHRLAMPINVDAASRFLLSWLLPYRCSPLPASGRASLSSSRVREVGEKSLDVPLAA